MTGQVERIVGSLFERMSKEARLGRGDTGTLKDLARRLGSAGQSPADQAKPDRARMEQTRMEQTKGDTPRPGQPDVDSEPR